MFKVLKGGFKALCLELAIIIKRAFIDLSLAIVRNLRLVRTD
jgi:hypothetical protein